MEEKNIDKVLESQQYEQSQPPLHPHGKDLAKDVKSKVEASIGLNSLGVILGMATIGISLLSAFTTIIIGMYSYGFFYGFFMALGQGLVNVSIGLGLGGLLIIKGLKTTE